jgi:glycosyltransferase involved in cell wall biosynthesis
MAHLNFLVLLLRPFFPSRTRVLVRQNGTVSAALAFGDLPSYTRLLYRLLYRRADRVICQTQAMADDLAREARVPTGRLTVLPNPVDVDGIRAAMLENAEQWVGPGPHLMAIGRLAPVKGFDLLLRAFAVVHGRFPTADLLIAGDGPEDVNLKSLALQLGLQEAVRFAGHVEQPAVYFAGATLVVLSSRHEGMPNALLEAVAGGLPIVALPASQGVVDLLKGQPGAWLAPEATVEDLANAILAALQSLQPGQRFPHPFVKQFSLARSIHAYERLIDATIKERQP